MDLLPRNPAVLAVVDQLLGAGRYDPAGSTRGVYCTLPHPPGHERRSERPKIHVDWSHGDRGRLGAIAYIDDVEPEAGAFGVWPGQTWLQNSLLACASAAVGSVASKLSSCASRCSCWIGAMVIAAHTLAFKQHHPLQVRIGASTTLFVTWNLHAKSAKRERRPACQTSRRHARAGALVMMVWLFRACRPESGCRIQTRRTTLRAQVYHRLPIRMVAFVQRPGTACRA